MEYGDIAQSDALPEMSRTGFALKMGVRKGRASYASITAVHEGEKVLVGDAPSVKKNGVEAGIMGVFFFRVGELDDPGFESRVNTMGFGVSLAGGIAWLAQTRKLQADGAFSQRLLENFDLSFDMGWYDHRSKTPIQGTRFYRIRLSI